ncbi:MAG: DUF1127 domain-containing protein [Magnetospirillum sp.]|nr:DUF1127 domain-containing protein [Magnetospirillum sp.]
MAMANWIDSIAAAVDLVLVWIERRHERAQLAALSDRALSDFACSRAEAWQEWHKPVWRG